MYKVTVETDNGVVRTFNDVIDYDVLTRDDVEMVMQEVKSKKRITKKLLQEIERRCEESEYFPNMDGLRGIVREILRGE